MLIFINCDILLQKLPAESRAMNGECVFMDFYDKHDVWHMSFACAMFFIFLVSLIEFDIRIELILIH